MKKKDIITIGWRVKYKGLEYGKDIWCEMNKMNLGELVDTFKLLQYDCGAVMQYYKILKQQRSKDPIIIQMNKSARRMKGFYKRGG